MMGDRGEWETGTYLTVIPLSARGCWKKDREERGAGYRRSVLLADRSLDAPKIKTLKNFRCIVLTNDIGINVPQTTGNSGF
jgi:hypothetical protein